MTAQLAETPNYVLLDHGRRIGPELLTLDSGQQCTAIYGFSDKQPYDAFSGNSQLSLAPYPLVKGYLENQVEAADEKILIVIVNAPGPNEQILLASTMQTVLDAQKKSLPQVAVSYRLTKDKKSTAYKVEECVSDVPMPL